MALIALLFANLTDKNARAKIRFDLFFQNDYPLSHICFWFSIYIWKHAEILKNKC